MISPFHSLVDYSDISLFILRLPVLMWKENVHLLRLDAPKGYVFSLSTPALLQFHPVSASPSHLSSPNMLSSYSHSGVRWIHT